MADAGGASGTNLVQMAQHVESRAAPPVVQLAVRQHAEECGLAHISVTEHSQTQVHRVTVIGHLGKAIERSVMCSESQGEVSWFAEKV